MFQQDTLSGKDKQLTQGYQNQQMQLNKQRQQIEEAKQRQDRHIDDLEARYQAALSQQRQHEQRQEQEKQQHEQIIKQQKEISDRNDQNIKNQIAAAKANNDALIAANTQLTQSQIDANAQNNQALIAANAQNTQSVIQNATDAANANLLALQSLGAHINGLQANFAALGNQFQNLNTNMNNLGNKINNPPFAPTPGVPPGCDPAVLTQLSCSKPTWNMRPEITNARNVQGDTNINIFRCMGGAHYCASDGGYGDWRGHGPPSGYYY